MKHLVDAMGPATCFAIGRAVAKSDRHASVEAGRLVVRLRRASLAVTDEKTKSHEDGLPVRRRLRRFRLISSCTGALLALPPFPARAWQSPKDCPPVFARSLPLVGRVGVGGRLPAEALYIGFASPSGYPGLSSGEARP
jgi:hypothetical protein